MITDQFNNDFIVISAQNQSDSEKQQIKETSSEKQNLHEFFLENHEPWLIKSSKNNLKTQKKNAGKNTPEKNYRRSKYYDIKPIIINRKPKEAKKRQSKRETTFDFKNTKPEKNKGVRKNSIEKNHFTTKNENQNRQVTSNLRNLTNEKELEKSQKMEKESQKTNLKEIKPTNNDKKNQKSTESKIRINAEDKKNNKKNLKIKKDSDQENKQDEFIALKSAEDFIIKTLKENLKSSIYIIDELHIIIAFFEEELSKIKINLENENFSIEKGFEL
ncbi:hypothetical protein EDEG_00112 [Edhazardia aedis USNM 41457]|uniref:Uncharacterized protein n=1 Tax=Edhazardia aedis (strain USNM 41457) TaxID=1003232 RepID=J9DUB9_EDHAE|nr:hypothetical protein EDEG_00112 [Edhazardia aedis USNM 41457]|eukprot:EJW04892.1 hypothetical protein EDEG_00112 [Edhazardia aedis USNM 41457]